MKHFVMVLSDPSEGQEEEFNRWYEDLHLDEVIGTTNWESAQRFVLSDQLWQKCPHQHLALYEVEADDPKDVLRKLNETRNERQQSTAINMETASVWVFTENGPKHVKQA